MSHLLRRVGISALVALCFTAPAFARSVTIAWDANTESDLAGYVVRYGTAPGNYTVAIDVGNRTDFALTLDEFTTYYVAVEAYDVAGDHSPLSSEVVVGADYSTCDFSLNSTSANIGPSASSLTVGLTAQSACPWNAVSYSSWITISGRTATRGSGTVSLAIATNPTGTSRVGTVVIGGRSLLVVQGSASCTMSATAADFGVFVKEGGSGSIAVSASGAHCGWSASSDAAWLTFSGSASRSGTGPVAFTVAANSGAVREGHLTVAGTVFTIAQRARKRSDALDFDGRGADAFLYSVKSGDWTRYTWTRTTFAASQVGVSTPGMTILPADFNGDDRSDLFAYDTRTGVWARSISNADGTVRFVESVWQAGWAPTIADFNGDGHSDVFFYNPRTGAWVQWITQPSTLAFASNTGRFAPGWTVYRAVFDADGRDDLFLYNANAKRADRNAGKWAQALTGRGLDFVIKPGKTAWSTGATVVPADFTGDGLSEVFLLTASGRWTVVTFTAKGATSKGGQWAAGWSAWRATFNADNLADLFLYNPRNGRIRVLLRKGTNFTILKGAWSRGLSVQVADVNDDGLSDVIVYHATAGGWGSAMATAKPAAFVFQGGSFDKSRTLLAGHSMRP
jgi:Putative binding domain, N-terminal/Viral BACON domain